MNKLNVTSLSLNPLEESNNFGIDLYITSLEVIEEMITNNPGIYNISL